MQELSTAGRLFVPDGNVLRRISSVEALERLLQNKPITLVDHVRDVVSNSNTARSTRGNERRFLSDAVYSSSRSSSTSTRDVVFSRSEVRSLALIQFAAPNEGIPDAAELPRSGTKVRVSSTVVAQYEAFENKVYGFFRGNQRVTQKSGNSVQRS